MSHRCGGNSFCDGARFHLVEGVGPVLHLGDFEWEFVLVQVVVVAQQVHPPSGAEGKLPTAVEEGGAYAFGSFPLRPSNGVVETHANCDGSDPPVVQI